VGPEQWHFAEFAEFPTGTTAAQAEAAMSQSMKSGEPPAGVKRIGAIKAASPGYGNTFTTAFDKGRVYVVADFLPDRSGGPPHAIGHEMWRVFAVP